MVSPQEPEIRFDSPNFELASRQASLAFERTLISLDQSLMGAVRTSLALISFGFAMLLFAHQFSASMGVDLSVPARNFELTLLAMGTALLTVALLGHRKRFTVLSSQMDGLHHRRLLVEGCPYRRSAIAVFAVLLLVAGLLLITGVIIRIEPFG
jgi:uncharacterized membrane protein YidH (DUF202 family)